MTLAELKPVSPVMTWLKNRFCPKCQGEPTGCPDDTRSRCDHACHFDEREVSTGMTCKDCGTDQNVKDRICIDCRRCRDQIPPDPTPIGEAWLKSITDLYGPAQ